MKRGHSFSDLVTLFNGGNRLSIEKRGLWKKSVAIEQGPRPRTNQLHHFPTGRSNALCINELDATVGRKAAQELDLERQHIKKAKPNGDEIILDASEDSMDATTDEIVQIVTDVYTNLDFADKNTADVALFNPKPTFDVSLEEYDSWSKPWKSSLIVKLLGKTLGFRPIESWILITWRR
ncbi:hypothetical protein PIB30_038318 [Stylosanthes scabra]|uniref:Uncharacterized protein n=1 Tax=Stylosanthes scabra TaxID=79078 RepID=A0ABU6UDA6_9FABA|nr:hypothetical protein [Stylosanthes scabra]